ncbi:hypothetical protein LTR56_015845 [Elasticomyces elasticus]|nr:hypothetical protein LTR22_023044 [Elasticomyces elasticus]KAK3633430.1 hypothetical protein LTR56_015845 [Elasticomyces elasticus]KAK4922051.1 hypothetical protein LTR49_010637 [Elasticomyces elasticus]
MSTSEHSDCYSASEANWSAASDASGMFEIFVDPPQQYYHDYVNTGAILTLDVEIHRPALTHSDSIRLIVVEPSSSINAPVHLSFAVTTLANPSAYYGFSYAWGPTLTDGSHLTDTVYLDTLPLRVTAHLHGAFKNIRRHAHRVCSTDLLTLWIDTLCIDQQNVDERNSQVAMMGRIYAQACAVILWVGTLGPSSHRSLKEAILLEEQDVNVAPGGTSPACSIRLPADVSDSIVDQAYFSRRWVIQEVLMQPNRYVLVADQLITFESLQLTIANRGKLSPLGRRRKDRDHAPLLTNLIRYSTTECFDLRDRLFSLLAISDETHGIIPDYCISYTNLYIRFATSCIREGQLSTILACAAATRRYSGTNFMAMPSWVPDWRQCFRTADVRETKGRRHNPRKTVVYNDRVQFDAHVYWLCERHGSDRLIWDREHCDLILLELQYLLKLRNRQAVLPDCAGDPDSYTSIGNGDSGTKALIMCVTPGARCVLLLSSEHSDSGMPSESQTFRLVDNFPFLRISRISSLKVS